MSFPQAPKFLFVKKYFLTTIPIFIHQYLYATKILTSAHFSNRIFRFTWFLTAYSSFTWYHRTFWASWVLDDVGTVYLFARDVSCGSIFVKFIRQVWTKKCTFTHDKYQRYRVYTDSLGNTHRLSYRNFWFWTLPLCATYCRDCWSRVWSSTGLYLRYLNFWK